jgi:hypothetical protein
MLTPQKLRSLDSRKSRNHSLRRLTAIPRHRALRREKGSPSLHTRSLYAYLLAAPYVFTYSTFTRIPAYTPQNRSSRLLELPPPPKVQGCRHNRCDSLQRRLGHERVGEGEWYPRRRYCIFPFLLVILSSPVSPPSVSFLPYVLYIYMVYG